MDTRLYNATIMTMEPASSIFYGEVWITGDTIDYVGIKPEEIPPSKQSIDLQGNLLLPGFKNAHSHSPMVFLRSMADDMPLLDWLHKQVFPMEAKLMEEDAYHLTKLAILEYLSSGITASFDMYLFPYAIATASAKMGFRNVFCGALNDFTHGLDKLEAQFNELNNYHPLVTMQLGFHAEYTTSKDLLQGVAHLSQKYKAPVFTHLAESKRETDDCIQRTGKTPTAYLNDLGLWEHGGGGFHCIHMTEEDLQIFANKKLSVITCPGSNVKLASGIPHLLKIAKKSIPIAIGTDGAASNNALDFFREMYLTSTLQKIKEKNASVMPANLVLEYATIGGAAVMGLENCSTIAKGKKADLVAINLQQPNMQPIHNLAKNLVYSGSKNNIAMTMIAGKILYQNGNYFVGEKPEDIYKKANKIVQRLSKK